jgi:uncharacterized damage-inducible protein DinB
MSAVARAASCRHTPVMDQIPASALFPDWKQYAARITRAVAALTQEQLALRASPEHSPIWALAAHVAGMHLYWLCVVCGEPGIASSTVIDPTTLEGWEDDLDHPRSADELVGALDASWAVVADCLGRWTPAMLAEEIERSRNGVIERHTRLSILNRMLSHDAYHAGEISQLLGVAGLPEIDLWGREPGD